MITSKRMMAIINRQDEIMNLAREFVDSQNNAGRKGTLKIDGDIIFERVNTACHCHPEYELIERGTLKEFGEWLDVRNSRTEE